VTSEAAHSFNMLAGLRRSLASIRNMSEVLPGQSGSPGRSADTRLLRPGEAERHIPRTRSVAMDAR
jgi:hypothetical protein